MDRYDPGKKVDLILDEWGTWYDVEPGTNPGFLYQQNSLRDAIVAGLNLNIFNNFCERLYMANIAQTVNVLQAMVLTQDAQMVRTPTYYVYKLYVPHHDAVLLPTQIKCTDYAFDGDQIPSLNASASMDQSQTIHLSVVNADPSQEKSLECKIYGKKVSTISGQILTAETMNDYNDFGKPEAVTIKDFSGARLKNGLIQINIPSKSIIMLELN